MKQFVLLCVCAVTTAFYTDVDEHIDLIKNLNDPSLMHKYVDCFLDKGPCTDIMTSYKKHFYEAVDNACALCSPSQKHIVEEFFRVMVKKYPDDLTDIKKKYDPEGIHFKRFLTEVDKF